MRANTETCSQTEDALFNLCNNDVDADSPYRAAVEEIQAIPRWYPAHRLPAPSGFVIEYFHFLDAEARTALTPLNRIPILVDGKWMHPICRAAYASSIQRIPLLLAEAEPIASLFVAVHIEHYFPDVSGNPRDTIIRNWYFMPYRDWLEWAERFKAEGVVALPWVYQYLHE